MSIALVQSATGKGASVTLTGVAAGNTLILLSSYFRDVSSGVAMVAPTDTQGTWSVAASGVPGVANSTDCGTGIFYQGNVASGTHTVTPQSTFDRVHTLAEFSGLTSAPFDVGATAKTDNSSFTSQVTGTTATTGQADELVVISLGLACSVGVNDVGFTDPVSGFTTLQKVTNDASDVATMHAYKTINAIGNQSATFNWTDNESGQFAGAAIATFKAALANVRNLLLLGVG